MHGLEIIVVVITMIFLETMFVITIYVNGVMEGVTQFFHCIKYIGERQAFNTARDFQPLTINLSLFEAKTGILK